MVNHKAEDITFDVVETGAPDERYLQGIGKFAEGRKQSTDKQYGGCDEKMISWSLTVGRL